MKSPERRQLKFRVDPATAKAVKEYCGARGITETALLQAAVQQYLAGTSNHEVLFRRLDRIAHEVSRASASLELVGEMFGTFVQTWFAHNPEIDDHEKPAAQRAVARRYRAFLAHVISKVRKDLANTALHQLIGGRVPLADDSELDRVRAGSRPPPTAAESTERGGA